ncbi:MAG: AAA family ATPase [Planctomycetota bacterium]|jgi:SpoVK/Ycf46/Vps4 family AAA+-type ATPase
MNFLAEILKIIDGGLGNNPDKLISYAKLLAEKVEKNGQKSAARAILKTVERKAVKQIQTSGINLVGQIPVDGESRIALADEFQPKMQDVPIFLEEKVDKVIQKFLLHINAADKLIAEGVGISPSMILYGPPGCGKTRLGQFIAAQLGLPLLTARTDALISSYLGNTAKNLRTLFEHALQRPCVLFLDEFDALAKLRDDKYELGELKRVVVSLLQNIDALDRGTILLAATNHEHLLDPAIWRRFAYKLHLDKPSKIIRKKLFQHFCSEFISAKTLHILAEASEGLTGGDIRQISEDSKRQAIINNKNSLNFDEFIPLIFSNVLNLEYNDIEEHIKYTRNLNPKLFTYRRLSKIFNVSIGKISKIFSKDRIDP